MSVMDMFKGFMGSNQQQQQGQSGQTPGAGQPGNIPQNGDNQNGQNPQVPANQQQALQSPAPIAGPLDDFATLWQPVETNSSNPASGILGAIDPTKVMEAAGKTDFSKVITQDNLTKIQAGGPEAMQAMMEAMNRMAQTVYGQAAIASSKMVEQAATRMEAKFKTDLPGEFKRLNVSENLRDSNPIFSNPAVAPLINAMEQQFTVKYPTASSKEITEMAQRYVSGLGSVFNPTLPTPAQTAAAGKETDWEKFF